MPFRRCRCPAGSCTAGGGPETSSAHRRHRPRGRALPPARAGLSLGASTSEALPESKARLGRQPIPFYGAHQAGIATPTQEFVHFLALDMESNNLGDLRALLIELSAAAADIARGRVVGATA